MDLLLTVDRFEEDTAVLLVRPCEERSILWPIADLPPDCKEGDILTVTVEVSRSETEAARERVESLLHRLLNKTQAGQPAHDTPDRSPQS
ncbi:MAG: DUF3006 domain-containing protein [Firmicutes bacterium]|nr:DUF3006 domain-containing protein [Bacillota bacterium]